jgi:hypothetical protein
VQGQELGLVRFRVLTRIFARDGVGELQFVLVQSVEWLE